MKKIIMFLCIAILFVFKTNNVLAVDELCTSEEKMRLQQLVNATKITYEFYEEIDPISGFTFQGFKVNISNFKPDFYIYNEEKSVYFPPSNESIVTKGKFVGGVTYELPFYASNNTKCDGYLIMTKYVRMVPYNPYWKDPLCKGYETYELCKKFSQIELSSYEEFELRMNQYIKMMEKKDNVKEPPIEENENNEVWQSIVDFVINNYMIFLVFIIVIGLISIIIIKTKQRRRIL